MTVIAGLDVGGAHLKVALVEDSTTTIARQLICPLWKGFEHLVSALQIAKQWTDQADSVAITMTGELSDIFVDRQQGVEELVHHLADTYSPRARFWCGGDGFHDATYAQSHAHLVGSANFIATAQLAAQDIKNGLLIDMGSTTTDIIALRSGHARPTGLSDLARLQTGELIYTGLTRTACMGLLERAPFQGVETRLTHEYFATMADVYRILGRLNCGVDLHDTADGKGKSIEESITRLARMFGCDAKDASQEEWKQCAELFAEAQSRRICDGIDQVLAAHRDAELSVFVTAGIGCDVISKLSERYGAQSIPFSQIANVAPDALSEANHCAPAVAVAHLLSNQI